MKILGIDIGFECGWCVIEKMGKNEIKVLSYGVIIASAKKHYLEQLFSIANDLRKLIKKFRPNVIVIEPTFKNTKFALLIGMCLEMAREEKIPVYLISPRKARRLLNLPLSKKHLYSSRKIKKFFKQRRKLVSHIIDAFVSAWAWFREPKPSDFWKFHEHTTHTHTHTHTPTLPSRTPRTFRNARLQKSG